MKKRFLSTLLALCMVLALLPGTALAAKAGAITGTNLSWTLDDNGLLSITGSGTMPDYDHYGNTRPQAPWYASRSQITSLYIGKGVANIGRDAMFGCGNIQTIRYGGSVEEWQKVLVADRWLERNTHVLYTSTSTMTFDGSPNTFVIQAGTCASNDTTTNWTLDSGGMLTISGSGAMPAYSRYDHSHNGQPPWYPRRNFITGITIKSGITSISEDAFYGCSNVTNISLPVSLTKIDAAFAGCNKIKNLNYAGTAAQWNQVTVNSGNNNYLFGPNVNMNFSTGAITRYTLTLNANGGTITGDTARLVTKGDAFGELPIPTRKGYEFAGWFTEKTGGKPVFATTTATKNQTIYAQWLGGPAASMTVTFNVNGGKALATSSRTKSVTKDQTYGTLPTPTRTGYKFAGWYTAKTGGAKVLSTTKVTKTANHTLYARWTPRTYLVTFNANGGSVYQDTKTVFKGVAYRDLPTPTRSGYHFKGWYTKASGGTKVSENTRVNLTGNQTLYAQWQTTATAKTPQRGTWKVTIPAYYELALYTTNNTAKAATTVEKTTYQTITCTQKTTLSNGVVRYYGTVNNKGYWFTYSCEMDVA